jgi:hypothetical protein
MQLIIYRVEDEKGRHEGTFRELKHAQEHAQETANELKKDMFIQKITTELLECFIPDSQKF